MGCDERHRTKDIPERGQRPKTDEQDARIASRNQRSHVQGIGRLLFVD